MADDLPLVARATELVDLQAALDAAANRRGQALLITGEAGIGKTRLLDEARALATRRGLLVLKGRAVESGGAYRPLVEAFARPAAHLAQDPGMTAIRPVLARVLPGWPDGGTEFIPMADPAAVLAEALMVLIEAMATTGALLALDDLHWADPDTFSVLASLVESVDDLPVALVLAARDEPHLRIPVDRLGASRSVRRIPLKRLTSSDVGQAISTAILPGLAADQIEQLVGVVDGLPLVLDEVARQVRSGGSAAGSLDFLTTSLAGAVHMRIHGLTAEARAVVDALAVLEDADTALLTAVTGLDEDSIAGGLHAGLASTLLLPASTPLGVTWRHRLIGDAVRNLLLPLEQQTIAQRAADHLVARGDQGDGDLHQAAILYEIAGHPNLAAQALIRAARLAVRNAALGVADQYLADAARLTGRLPDTAKDVLIERIETLTLAGRAGDAYHSGMAALADPASRDTRRILIATARAAYAGRLVSQGAELVGRLEHGSDAAVDADLAVLRADAASCERRHVEAISLGEEASILALHEGRFDLACEALLLSGHNAGVRGDTLRGADLLNQALDLSRRHNLPVWEVRALLELGLHDLVNESDPTRFEQARERAAAAGMVGMVAELDMWIGHAMTFRTGFVSAYRTFLRADLQAQQFQLTWLHAWTYAHLAECLVHADDQPILGESRAPSRSAVDAMVAEAIALAERSRSIPWAQGIPGVRAWLSGDDATAIRVIEENVRNVWEERQIYPWWGAIELVRVIHDGVHPDDAFAPLEMIGHHANRAAYTYGTAIWQLRNGESSTESLAQAESQLRPAPFMRHLLRTIAAPALFRAGVADAEGWLREADAYCGELGERALQRRVRQALALIGARIPRSTGTVPPSLARLSITAREAEILQLVNAGLSNTDIAKRLIISVRTVETHVSSLLQKTGATSRDQLASAAET